MESYYKKLKVWQASIILSTEIYLVIKAFPKEELYIIVDQIKRSCISISSNIAEGSGRKNKKEFIQFLYIAKGSALELETQLIIAKNIGFLKQKDLENLQTKILGILKMLSALIKSLDLTK